MKNPQRDGLVVHVSSMGDPEKAAAQAIRTFTKKVRNSGLMQELMDRQAFEKPSVKKKKKHLRALRNLREEENED